MIRYYGADGQPLAPDDVEAFLNDLAARRIGLDNVTAPDGARWEISTIHTVVDYQAVPGGPPVTRETMVTYAPAAGPDWRCIQRHSGQETAVAVHALALDAANAHVRERREFQRRMSLDPSAGQECVLDLNGVPVPYVYGLDGKPTDLMTGASLFEDIEKRTLRSDTVQTAEGPCQVRTVFFVYDDAAAVCQPDPLGPKLWGTALVIANNVLRPIAEYRSPQAADSGHAQAVARLRGGELPSHLRLLKGARRALCP
ncbi:hypothetical protein [Streptomyces sp. CBMA29]|uniref:hypothetical protein n=1 Tax=Streptomyces sp. CBMA29 TaxID=1896314 RepID=UPI001661F211|nr:hypothetical protein [Streptomyces sp. CBMA29]MBD0734031.1 hypothetical protein [Streptomyces sp. CBMA29]